MRYFPILFFALLINLIKYNDKHTKTILKGNELKKAKERCFEEKKLESAKNDAILRKEAVKYGK